MGLGYVKQYFPIALLILFTSSAIGQKVNRQKYVFDNPEGKFNIEKSDNSIVLNYSLSELNIENILTENGTFYRLGIPGHIPTTEIGKPEIPVLSRLINIPEGSGYKIRITDVKSTRIKPGSRRMEGILYPAQEGETKSIQQRKPEFKIDKSTYATRGYTSKDTVRIEQISKLREKNLASLYIYPVKYNPHTNSIEVITSMKIEIIFSGSIESKSALKDSRLFGELLTKGIINYNPDEVIPGYTDSPVRMIILTDTSFKKHLEPYIRWKTQKGFKLDILYRGADFAGNNYLALKDTIQSIYESATSDNPAPDYLLIVGDVAKVPYYGTGAVTDMYYGEFDGDGDYIPEMFIGRLPVSDTNDLKSVVNKIIQYEKFEFADTNRFYSNALITAGSDGSHSVYMNGQVNYGSTYYLTGENKINGYSFLNGAATEDSIKKLINSGLSFINYTGHGEVSGWSYPAINNADISTFTNKSMYPFIISNACLTSVFSTTSFGNETVLAQNKGAIGFIGCAADSFWDEDYYWAVGAGAVSANPDYEETGLGALDHLFHTHGEQPTDWYVTMGQVNYAGNLSVSSSTSTNKKYYWERYNLVGDPSIIPFIGTPDTFNLVLPDTLPDGIKSYSLPAPPFSYAAVSHFDTLWDASYVSPGGAITLEMPGLSNDSCLLVISGQNKVPVIKTIYFSEISSEFINLSASEINDATSNDNGFADFGETFYYSFTISNLGNTDATNLSATLTSDSEWLTLSASPVNIGTLASGSEITLDNDFSISVSGEVPDNTIATLELILKDDRTEKHYLIDLCMHSPELNIITCVLDDSSTGNGNLIADPGETLNLIFRIENLGSSSTSGQLEISSLSDEIDIIEPSKNSGTLQFGEISEISVPIKISGSANSGTLVPISAILSCYPYLVNKDFSFKIGRVRESFELASFRIFPWINISAKPWIITQTSASDGAFSARSGQISNNATSTLAIKVNYSESDTLKFNYRVSSEAGYDFFSFRLNGAEIIKKSGEVPWTSLAVPVPGGYNKFEWIYKKDVNEIEGMDCAMIDMIDFTGAGGIRYIEKDIVAARIVSPVQKNKIGEEPVTIKLLNVGPDTIDGFNFAYAVNNELPVYQHFTNMLIPFGDSVTITFNTKADLSLYGVYDLVTYSYGNDDDYLLNDTLKTNISNTEIDDPLVIFPNPFTDEFKVLINTDKTGTARISLTSVTGQKMMDLEKEIIPVKNEIVIREEKLKPGVYYLRIEFPGLYKSIPLVKVK
jgi:hypothetical protein